jgi:hypothetical protein
MRYIMNRDNIVMVTLQIWWRVDRFNPVEFEVRLCGNFADEVAMSRVSS